MDRRVESCHGLLIKLRPPRAGFESLPLLTPVVDRTVHIVDHKTIGHAVLWPDRLDTTFGGDTAAAFLEA